jgi:hypothetical protein
MTDFLREVDEEVRRDKAARVWRRYGSLIVAAALLVVLAVGGWRAWQWQVEKGRAEAGQRFETAARLAREGKAAEAEAAFNAMAQNAPGGYAHLARLRGIAELGKRDVAAAVSAYDRFAADTTAPALLRDLAQLKAGALLADSGPFADLVRRLEPLAEPTGAWRFSALEILAAAALKANEGTRAIGYLDRLITDPAAPTAARQRAELLIGLARAATRPAASQ